MTPRQAVRHKDIYRLQSDNADTAEGWILIEDGDVTLATQRCGEAATSKVTFTRRTFNSLIDWYNKDQKVRPKT